MEAYQAIINIRARIGSKRGNALLECAKEYGCEPDIHLIDRLLEDRQSLFVERKRKAAAIAEAEARLAEDKRILAGGQ